MNPDSLSVRQLFAIEGTRDRYVLGVCEQLKACVSCESHETPLGLSGCDTLGIQRRR